MKLQLNWHRSVKLGKFPYGTGAAVIPATAGIYVFLRVHGESAEALYVGKATNLKSRIKQQLNNLKLMTAIQKATNGERRLVFAEFTPKPGQKVDKAIPICEKTLIRYYLAQGHGLVNIQGTTLRFHELDSDRSDLKNFLPLKTKIQVK
jgi:hypothetical protein